MKEPIKPHIEAKVHKETTHPFPHKFCDERENQECNMLGKKKRQKFYFTKALCLEGAEIKRFADMHVATGWKCVVFTFTLGEKRVSHAVLLSVHGSR